MLWPAAGADVYDVGRLDVPAALAPVARHYWWVRWRRAAARPFRPQVLGHPVAHLTVEDAEGGTMHGLGMPCALVHGLVTRVFEVDLPPAGRVAGVALQPGALTALTGVDARSVTDRVLVAEDVLGPDVRALARQVLQQHEEAERLAAFVAYLGGLFGPVTDRVREDTSYTTARAAVDLMRAREHTTIAPVADRLHVSPRTLQRIFARYLGVSPLWVLRRYRLQDAATAIDAGDGEDLAALAADLGFADQAHLTRAFTEVIGVPPSVYRAAGQEHDARPTVRGGSGAAR